MPLSLPLMWSLFPQMKIVKANFHPSAARLASIETLESEAVCEASGGRKRKEDGRRFDHLHRLIPCFLPSDTTAVMLHRHRHRQSSPKFCYPFCCSVLLPLLLLFASLLSCVCRFHLRDDDSMQSVSPAITVCVCVPLPLCSLPAECYIL